MIDIIMYFLTALICFIPIGISIIIVYEYKTRRPKNDYNAGHHFTGE